MRVVGTKSTKDRLCRYCQLSNKGLWSPDCPKANHIKFGNSVGDDNVIECSEFSTLMFHSTFPIKGMPEYGVIKRAEIR